MGIYNCYMCYHVVFHVQKLYIMVQNINVFLKDLCDDMTVYVLRITILCHCAKFLGYKKVQNWKKYTPKFSPGHKFRSLAFLA